MDKNHASRREKIIGLLQAAFHPVTLEVIDESAKHVGHAGHRAGGESHYRVTIVSERFTDMSKIAAHRAVYGVLATEMQEGGIHALTLDVKAPLAET